MAAISRSPSPPQAPLLERNWMGLYPLVLNNPKCDFRLFSQNEIQIILNQITQPDHEDRAVWVILKILTDAMDHLNRDRILSLLEWAIRHQTLGPILVSHILDKGIHLLNLHDFQSIFHLICSNYPLSHKLKLLEFLWPKMTERASNIKLQLCYQFTLMNAVTNMFSSRISLSEATDEETCALLDWYLEKLLFFHGKSSPSFSFNPIETSFATPAKKGLILRYLADKGIVSTPSSPMAATPNLIFQPHLFVHTFAPGGISIYENFCRKHSETLSTASLRWIFAKAALCGKEGHPLMQWLHMHTSERLSPITYARAAEVATRAGHFETAHWIQEHCELHSSPTASSSTSLIPSTPDADDDDLIFLLATSHDSYETSYRPLGNAPQLYGWKPLDDVELSKLMPAGYVTGDEDPFAESDLIVVDDGCESSLALNEIHTTEASHFRTLYALIRDGHTLIKIKDEPDFKNTVLALFRTLLTRPSGRWTLLWLIRGKKDLKIKPFKPDPHAWIQLPKNEYNQTSQTITIDPITIPQQCKRKNGLGEAAFTEVGPEFDSTIQHELLHAIHCDQNPSLFDNMLYIPSSEFLLSNLEEQYTIMGIDSLDPRLHRLKLFALTDNTYRYERGYLGRLFHQDI